MINDEIYTVKFVTNLPGMIGQCCGGERIIKIKKGLSPHERFKTYIHEVAHAIEFEWGISIPHELIDEMEAPLAHFFLTNF